jgi:hypothetical protein
MKPKRVELHIEELVVDGMEGVGTGDSARLGTSVERELGRLIAEQGLPPRHQQQGRKAQIDAGELMVTGFGATSALGAHIARKVYGGTSG